MTAVDTLLENTLTLWKVYACGSRAVGFVGTRGLTDILVLLLLLNERVGYLHILFISSQL